MQEFLLRRCHSYCDEHIAGLFHLLSISLWEVQILDWKENRIRDLGPGNQDLLQIAFSILGLAHSKYIGSAFSLFCIYFLFI